MGTKRKALQTLGTDLETARGVDGRSTVSPSDLAALDGLRDEIQAAIAAGREVGPDMDRHLADSVVDRYHGELTARMRAAQALVPSSPKPVQRRADGTNLSETVLALAGLAAIVAIIIWQPGFWWLIFILPGVLGAWGWGRHSHH